VEDDLRERQEQLRQAQSAAFAAAQDLSRVRNEITALDCRSRAISSGWKNCPPKRCSLEEERTGWRRGCRNSPPASSGKAQRRHHARLRRAAAEPAARIADGIADGVHRAGQIFAPAVREAFAPDVLEQLEGSHEGFDAGAVAALRQSRSVIGSLADRIRVPDQFVTAVENALGHNLQLVLTEQPSSAQEILADFNTNKSGRASVAALSIQQYQDEKQLAFVGEMAPGEKSAAAQAGLQNGQIVHAMSVIQAEPTVEPLLKSLLGRTFIASDLGTATAQIQNGHAGCDFVTLGGELLNRHGIYTGGYLNKGSNGKAPSSILGRKNQITELQAELAELQELVEEASRKRGALLSEQTELQASLQQAQTELRQQEVAIATREGEFKALQNSNRLLHQKIETVMFEVEASPRRNGRFAETRGAGRPLNELEARERTAPGAGRRADGGIGKSPPGSATRRTRR
jgi:chromosome segregation protein